MDYLVFSHLRWDFVFQRPQQLLTRCGRDHRVLFWEEPIYTDSRQASLRATPREPNITVLLPELPAGMGEREGWAAQQELLTQYLAENGIVDYVAWYYSPMAMQFTRTLKPLATVYDCMDELSAFRGAPPGLTRAEAQLFEAADLVFTGGQSLYEAKRSRHSSVHCFPSSIDFQHFSTARRMEGEPPDQAVIPRPRFGYCGVIDERIDTALLLELANRHPDRHFVMVGPVVKISESELPRAANIHYLGGKHYSELPAYLSGWDAALMPFAINEATRFISPTKTPEYLAAGRRVVSTPIRDVVSPYGDLGLVAVASTADDFSSALQNALQRESKEEEEAWLTRVDNFLARNSWDSTWNRMKQLVHETIRRRRSMSPSSTISAGTSQSATITE